LVQGLTNNHTQPDSAEPTLACVLLLRMASSPLQHGHFCVCRGMRETNSGRAGETRLKPSSHDCDGLLNDIVCPGARAFAMDTRSKRRWDSPPLTPEVAQAFREACAKFGYSSDHIIPHGSYLINLGSADPEMLAKSYAAFVDELQRCELLVRSE
jgi:hypothetical protein